MTHTITSTENLTDLLSHLVRMPTVTGDSATCRAALDWVEEQLADLPLTIKRYEHNGFPSLTATTSGTLNPKHPKLWLVGHIDVVPGPADSFKPQLKDGRLYGRGVHDMKFAIATFIALLQELGSSLSQYDLGLMLTSDEEVGGYDGVKWLLDEQGLRGDAVITPDSGGSWDMELGSKGIVWFEVSAKGRAAHASRTWEGQNAVRQIINFVDHVAANVPQDPCGDATHSHATVNLGSITTGGNATNQVPEAATARLDVRFPPELSLDDVRGWMDAAASQVAGTTYRELISDAPYLVKNNGVIAGFRQVVQDVTGHDVNPTTAHGSSDARHFARHNISTINVCPTGSGFHVPAEWVDVKDLGRFYEVIRRFTREFAGPAASN